MIDWNFSDNCTVNLFVYKHDFFFFFNLSIYLALQNLKCAHVCYTWRKRDFVCPTALCSCCPMETERPTETRSYSH